MFDLIARLIGLFFIVVGWLAVAATVIVGAIWWFASGAADHSKSLVRTDQLVVEKWEYQHAQMHVRVRNTSGYTVTNFTVQIRVYECKAKPINLDISGCDYLSTTNSIAFTRNTLIAGYTYTHSFMMQNSGPLVSNDPNIVTLVTITDVMAQD